MHECSLPLALCRWFHWRLRHPIKAIRYLSRQDFDRRVKPDSQPGGGE